MSTATQTLPAHKLASSGEKTTQKNVAPAINPHIAPVVAQAPMAANIKYGRINMEFFGFYQGCRQKLSQDKSTQTGWYLTFLTLGANANIECTMDDYDRQIRALSFGTECQIRAKSNWTMQAKEHQNGPYTTSSVARVSLVEVVAIF